MEVDQFVASLKPVTKILIFGISAVSIILSLNLINYNHLLLQFPNNCFDIWKYFTSLLFYGGFSINLVFELVFMLTH